MASSADNTSGNTAAPVDPAPRSATKGQDRDPKITYPAAPTRIKTHHDTRAGLPPITRDIVTTYADGTTEETFYLNYPTHHAEELPNIDARNTPYPARALRIAKIAPYASAVGAILVFAGAIFGRLGPSLPGVNAGAVSDALMIPGLAWAAAAFTMGVLASRHLRRNTTDGAAFHAALKVKLTYRDTLLDLARAFEYGHAHEAVILFTRLRTARNAILDQAGDGHAVGEPELRAALKALHTYAANPAPSAVDHDTAHEAVAAFVLIRLTNTTRQDQNR